MPSKKAMEIAEAWEGDLPGEEENRRDLATLIDEGVKELVDGHASSCRLRDSIMAIKNKGRTKTNGHPLPSEWDFIISFVENCQWVEGWEVRK